MAHVFISWGSPEKEAEPGEQPEKAWASPALRREHMRKPLRLKEILSLPNEISQITEEPSLLMEDLEEIPYANSLIK